VGPVAAAGDDRGVPAEAEAACLPGRCRAPARAADRGGAAV